MILVIVSKFNLRITERLEESTLKVLQDAGEKYKVVRVPGAVELPITAQHFIRKEKPNAVIALGCIIKGGTDHYELVSKSCIVGLTKVAIEESTPIIQGVLACHTFEDALARVNNGEEYAKTALEMQQLTVNSKQ